MQRIDIVKKQNCTGCAACSAICPKQCIKMKEDDKGGYLYPAIQENDCIKCGLCVSVCQAISYEFTFKDEIKAYIGTASIDDVKKSASGGVTTSISHAFINNGGVVYGSVFTSDLKVVHQRAETLIETELYRKSKYVQSNISTCFKLIENDLKKGLSVLFTGTSCQCAAINKYLIAKRVSTDRLCTINLLCHGVPSQHLFDVYKNELETKSKRKIKSYTFKNKKPVNGIINSRTAEIIYDNGITELVGIEQDSFLKMYYSKLAYRPSCMNCQFACRERIADITVADAWNIEQIMRDLNPLAGISMILVNSCKGADLFKSVKTTIKHEKISTEWALNSQSLFKEPTKAHKNRNDFLKSYQNEGFDYSVWKYTKLSLIIRLKIIIKRFFLKKVKLKIWLI